MASKKADYEFLILEYLKSYKLYHTTEETLEVMKSIINKEDIYLPSELKYIEKDVLSNCLSKLVIKQLNSNIPKKFDLSSLVPTIIENNMSIKEKKENRKMFKLSRATIIGTITAISIVSAISFGNIGGNKIEADVVTYEKKNVEVSKENNDYTNEVINSTNLKVRSKENEKEEKRLSKKYNKIVEEKDKLKSKRKKAIKKKKVLVKYKKVKTMKDIFKREKELKSLKLTKKDKVYKNCKLSPEVQRFIEEQSIVNNIPTDVTFTIISTETRGGFESSGTESYNAPGDVDLGLTQQNTVSRVTEFCKKFDISYDEAYKLIRDNDFVNLASAFLEYAEIRDHLSSFDAEEFAGLYNGWLDWRNKDISRQYVKIFNEEYSNKFTENHDVKTRKEDEKELNQEIKSLTKKINA